jgi:hypothetical protein
MYYSLNQTLLFAIQILQTESNLSSAI